MFQHILQSIKIALLSLLANKGRSFLTMLGIIIGVGAVIIIISVGAGAQSLILAQVESLGTNLIGILPGATEEDSPPASMMGIVITTLTYDDIMALKQKNNVYGVIDAIAYYNGVGTVSWGNNSYDTNISGSTAGYLNVEGGSIAEGRFMNSDEETNLSRVAILGSTVKRELFGDSEAVGQRIKIKKHMFEVIGVMEERGTVAMQDYDDKIIIPIKTMQKLLSGVNHVSMARIKIDNAENVDRAMSDIKATLRERHDIKDQSGSEDDFTVRSAAEALDMIMTITDALKYFLAAVAAIALIVGGIGIMNIMLISVRERTREIGLRKAVGAKNINIMNQFLIESISITLIGGSIGIIGGVIISFLISVGANLLNYNWDFIVSLSSMFVAVGVSMAVGLIFGLYPASKAAKLDPVEALRYE